MNTKMVFLFLCFFTLSNFLMAQVPTTISYQGVLSDESGLPVANGDYTLTFRLYDSESSSSPIWEEAQVVSVIDGIFGTNLGIVNPLNLDFDVQYWLGITVGSSTELEPRVLLTSSPYSLNTRQVLGVTNIFPSDGNVGIGIVNPAAKLEVNGSWTLGITGTLPGGADGRLYAPNGIYSEAGGIDWAHYFTTFGVGDIARFATGNLGEPLDTKMVIKNSGSVGIGITDPSDLLDVAGIISSTDGGFRFPDGTLQTTAAGSGTGNGNTLDQAYDQGGSGAGRFIEADAGAVHIYGTGDGLYVEGPVGIGTDSPTMAKMEVWGDGNSAIYARSSDYNTIYSWSDAGGGYAAGFFDASGSGTYGIWTESSDYDALYAYCTSASNTAIKAVATNGAYAGVFNGNVGIGTSDPAARLEVADYPEGTNDPVGIRITNLRSSLGLYWELRAYDSGSGGPYGRFSIFGGLSGGSDKFVVTTTGNIGIGTIDPVAKMEVIGGAGSNTIQASSSAGGGYAAGHYTATGSGTYAIWATSAEYDGIYALSNSSSHAAVRAVSAIEGSDAIYADGDISYTGELIDVSDRRFKYNIQPLNNALEKILKVKACEYEYKTDAEYSGMNLPRGRQFGFIAQDLENVIPELVLETVYQSSGTDVKQIKYKGVDYIEVIPFLVKAIQEQQDTINELKSQVKELQSKR